MNRRLFAACFGLAFVLASGHASISSGRYPAGSYLARGREQFTLERQLGPYHDRDGRLVEPLFNARSCAECHRQGGLGGGGPNANNVLLINLSSVRTVRSGPLGALHDLGDQEEKKARDEFFPNAVSGVMTLHHGSTSPDYFDWRLRRLAATGEHSTDSYYHLTASNPSPPIKTDGIIRCGCGTGRPPPAVEQRNTPALFGLGLLAEIPQSALDAIAARQPEAIRGRSPRLRGGGYGRFGWKAQTATLEEFNENACAAELGLRTPKASPAVLASTRRGAKLSTSQANVLKAAATVAVDMTADDLALLKEYVRRLPAPRQLPADLRNHAAGPGAKLFIEIGCAMCHVPNLGGVRGVYSDLLLHSIGTEGSGFYGTILPTPDPTTPKPEFDIVKAGEFRTPPLWGVADSAPYLHDGSAATLEQAIMRHTVQAENSRAAFERLSPDDRRQVIEFLSALHAPNDAEPLPSQHVMRSPP